MNRSARTKDDYKFSTAKDPLFNSTRICKVEDHYRQEHRCDWVRTGRNLGMLGQNLKGQKGLQGTESVLSVVNFVAFFMLINLVFLNHMQENEGLVYTQCMLAKR